MTVASPRPSDHLGTAPVPDGTVPLHPALAAYLAHGDFSDDAMRAFAAANPAPLREPGALTFFWQGRAEGVDLLRWVHAGVDRRAFTRHGDTGLWSLRLAARDNGRFEYKLALQQGHGEDWILDPANPDRAGDPFGENSVAMTWGYERPDWSMPQSNPAGRIETLEVRSDVFGEVRTEQIYLPPGQVPGRPYPLVVVHDGGDYRNYADLTVSLDNLIAAGDVPPLIAVLIQADDRMSEYPRGRRHARFLVQELLPAVAAAHPISNAPADRVLLGASLGAVASLATAFRYPGVFGGLILKSGSFILDPRKLAQRQHPVFQRIARLVQAFRRAPNLPPMRAFVSTGELEGLAEENRALADFLRSKGVAVDFQSSWDGHHWHNWRDQIRDALIWVFAPEAK
ncbi:alpha/beta hydrolase [Ovoidimarina sediminis]|uniref:alpha/beta hydrolase n=1 Tax=Ovoidimarina sediminis TaxID=3079856 RepID=UPI002907DC95|nr:alpha/beta hydrolase-fold protein [Rhodophyticola sp. MJ-SS7]MDU8945808.1 alpha/beta hydrolase-fold protein [Rhodophyticola sp. MJ-SS7]